MRQVRMGWAGAPPGDNLCLLFYQPDWGWGLLPEVVGVPRELQVGSCGEGGKTNLEVPWGCCWAHSA